MKEVGMAVLSFLIFPGFLFTAVIGLLAGWIDRKITARLQWRVGPPWYQNFVDFFKLMGKETIIPAGARKITFLSAPLIGLVGVTLVSLLLWQMNLYPRSTFVGDLIVIIYLSLLPSLAVVIGGAASGNPLASLGASREMKLILAYELPFIVAIFTPVGIIREIKIGAIVAYQMKNGMMFTHYVSSLLAFIVAFFCMQAKLTFVPFDIPEAEQEIMAGPLIEYSGPPLALFKLTKAMMLFALPVFLITVFAGGMRFDGIQAIYSVIKYLVILLLIILVKNTNVRLRIDQAIRFFWLRMLPLAVIGFVLSLFGI
ncbi:NADH-quinone oxidoreductase subunit H, partial [Candidatus Aerophobetes bacterium]|nr:NADH-quinone oxidoreductase subunit H [Candidatus Aerophobetes bacterium]